MPAPSSEVARLRATIAVAHREKRPADEIAEIRRQIDEQLAVEALLRLDPAMRSRVIARVLTSEITAA